MSYGRQGQNRFTDCEEPARYATPLRGGGGEWPRGGQVSGWGAMRPLLAPAPAIDVPGHSTSLGRRVSCRWVDDASLVAVSRTPRPYLDISIPPALDCWMPPTLTAWSTKTVPGLPLPVPPLTTTGPPMMWNSEVPLKSRVADFA